MKLLQQTTITPSSGEKTLQVLFPRHKRGGSLYVGGAHGTLGVLYVIAMACLMDGNESLLQQEGLIDILAQTCEDHISMQLSSGGFPTQRGWPERDGYLKSVKILVEWCHGAPGAIAPFLAACELFIKISKQQQQQNTEDEE